MTILGLLCLRSVLNYEEESCANGMVTARCPISRSRMSAVKIFGILWVPPRLLLPILGAFVSSFR